MADGVALLDGSIPELDFVQSNSELWIWYYDCATSGCILKQLLFRNVTNMVVYKPQCIYFYWNYGYSRVMHNPSVENIASVYLPPYFILASAAGLPTFFKSLFTTGLCSSKINWLKNTWLSWVLSQITVKLISVRSYQNKSPLIVKQNPENGAKQELHPCSLMLELICILMPPHSNTLAPRQL